MTRNSKLIQEQALKKVVQQLFKFKIIKLKKLLMNNQITKSEYAKKLNGIKNDLIIKYGDQVGSILRDPTIATWSRFVA